MTMNSPAPALFNSLKAARDPGVAAALDVKKVGRHDDEFAGHIDIQFLEGLQVLEVLPGDALDRDVVDVELIALDQIKQEIEWALENLELNLVIASHR